MSEHECIVSLIHLVNVVVHSSCNTFLWAVSLRFVADNRIDCNAAYLNILCRGFLANDGATCIDYGVSEDNTEPLDSVCDGELLDC